MSRFLKPVKISFLFFPLKIVFRFSIKIKKNAQASIFHKKVSVPIQSLGWVLFVFFTYRSDFVSGYLFQQMTKLHRTSPAILVVIFSVILRTSAGPFNSMVKLSGDGISFSQQMFCQIHILNLLLFTKLN